MTLAQLIARVRSFNETVILDSVLADWAAEMDGRIMREDYLRKEYDIAYDAEADAETMMLLGKPWDDMYVFHILEKIHFYRGEYEDSRNMAEQWNQMHGDWLRNMLSTTPVDVFGRPVLFNFAVLRSGSDGVVHMKTVFCQEDILSVSAQMIQRDELKLNYEDGTSQITVHSKHWITLELTAEDTAQLLPGGAVLVAKLQTVDGRSYESDPMQIRVMKSNLKEVTNYD